MDNKKEKAVLIELGNVRVRSFDDFNVTLEVYEQVKKDRHDGKTHEWYLKGYFRSITRALEYCVTNELFLDKKAVTDLQTHLKAISDFKKEVIERIS